LLLEASVEMTEVVQVDVAVVVEVVVVVVGAAVVDMAAVSILLDCEYPVVAVPSPRNLCVCAVLVCDW